MTRVLYILGFIAVTTLNLWAFEGSDAAGWRLALPGWKYTFPQDHAVHPEFQTEWWYFTGNLRDASGGEWGYQLTFFRKGINREDGAPLSRFVVRDLKFAHFAVSDLSGKKFVFAQRTSRGAYGEAGFEKQKVAWLEDWELRGVGENSFELRAAQAEMVIQLKVSAEKPPVLHGENGVSQKADGIGRASHYYSLTRMRTEGWLETRGKRLKVEGQSWFDHEWATNQLAANQLGWDWFSLQLEDGTELMIYQMRCKDGSVDPNSSGTFIDEKSRAIHLSRNAYRLTPLKYWKSKGSGATYPISWKIEVPTLQLVAQVSTPLESQELVLNPIAYWEGAVQAEITKRGKPVKGRGYMELTGYSGALVGIQAPDTNR